MGSSIKKFVMTAALILLVLGGLDCAPSSLRRSRASRAATETPSIRQSRLPDEFAQTESPASTTVKPFVRKNKALSFLGFFPSFFSSDLDYSEDDDEVTFAVNDESVDDEDLSRTIPSKRRNQNKKKNNYLNDNINSLHYDNSPIFYVRVPPTPYMFVPGLGYVSQPPNLGPPMSQVQSAPSVDPFINVPVEFVSNGKPTNVYRWPGAFGPPVNPFGFAPPPPPPPSSIDYSSYLKPQPPPRKPTYDAKVTSLKGPFLFNGKPSDKVFVLRDSYNSLYSDALQNFYP